MSKLPAIIADEIKASGMTDFSALEGLNKSQRAIVASMFAALKRGENKRHGHNADQLRVIDLQRLFETPKHMILEARMVLLRGSPELLAMAWAGKIPIRGAYNKMSKTQREAGTPKRLNGIGRNPERIQKFVLEQDVAARIRQGIDVIIGLPDPEDVARIVHANRQRSDYLRDKIYKAVEYLNRFSKEWEKNESRRPNASAAKDHPDAGNGAGNAGEEQQQPPAV